MPELEFIIDFTDPDESPIVFEVQDSVLEIEMISKDVNIYNNGGSFTQILSLIDLDNKFISVNQLSTIADKYSVFVFLENSGFKFEYGIDYTINSENQINWAGLALDGKLIVGDILKIYF